MEEKFKKIKISLFVILFGVFLRIFLNKALNFPNFEPITSLSLLSGFYLGGNFSFFVPLAMISLSDIYFGNNLIFLFTWSGFVLIGIFGRIFAKRKNRSFFLLTFLGIGSVLFFYLWTNFGWWLLTDMYEKNLLGILKCYFYALPFLKNQLLSVIIFTPIFSYFFKWSLFSTAKEKVIFFKKAYDSFRS